MSTGIPEIPPPLRPIAHYTKISNEYKERDVVIYYWCLYHAVQEGMRLDKSSPAALNFLTSALSSLESIKKANAGNEALTNDVVAQAHIESHALRLFNYADSQDRSSVFNKNIVKAFYTSGHLLDVLTNFGELDDNLQVLIKRRKSMTIILVSSKVRKMEGHVHSQLSEERRNTCPWTARGRNLG
jgi:vacuolar protein sorting-associated protein VTA1